MLQGRALRHHAAPSSRRGSTSCSSASASPTPPGGRSRPTPAACSGGSTSRSGLDPPPAGAVPRRAHHRPRPRGARADVGARSSGSPREERMTILLTTHYLEEADRLASQLAIVDRGRIVAARHAGRAEGASCRATPSRSSSPTTTGRRRAPRSSACRRRSARSLLDGRTLRARARRRRAPPSRPCSPRWRRAACARRLGDARAALARRRLPAPRRPGAYGGGGMTALRQTWQVTLRYLRVLAAPARVPRHHARAAADLAAAVRRAVQGRDRRSPASAAAPTSTT